MKIYRIAGTHDIEFKGKNPEYKDPSEMTEDEFIDYHKTGWISSDAYEDYKEELNWVKKSNFPILYSMKQFGDKTIEFRKTGEKNKYCKHTEPDQYGENDIARDENGAALYLSDDEVLQKGYLLYEATIAAFDGDLAVGLASDEFGADGIWVIEPYQRLGIGTYLLSEFRKQFSNRRKIGQMTNSGEELSRSYYRKLREQK